MDSSGKEAAKRGWCPRFFVSADLDVGANISLEQEDSRHAARVLRLRAGDRCEIVAGQGRVFSASVTAIRELVWLQLERELEGEEAGASYLLQVGLVQALPRPSAVDYLIEKGTEVGASFFWLVEGGGSPALQPQSLAAKLRRWQNIAREAAKQSKQTVVPEVAMVASVNDGLERTRTNGLRPVVLEPSTPLPLDQVVQEMSSSQNFKGLALWVGPEGGWTASELEIFAAAGMATARLGRGVLRTETAGPVGVAVARLTLRDW